MQWDKDSIIARAKSEIRADIAAGIVPATATRFSELHDYVDANGYGGAFETDAPHMNFADSADAEFWNGIQDALDVWLQAGRPSAPEMLTDAEIEAA